MKQSENYFLRQASMYLVIWHIKHLGSYLAIVYYIHMLDGYLFEQIKESQNS